MPRRSGPQNCGSSPRVRGTRGGRDFHARTPRFIPACAGNASPLASSRPAKPVHPRVCGERPHASTLRVAEIGSSPRVRGTRSVGQPLVAQSRFIPACAGNAPARPSSRPAPPVHPRVCGERAIADEIAGNASGSSPRVRGTPSARQSGKGNGRFIPACAGNACRSTIRRGRWAVHPRVCGERAENELIRRVDDGSSPRVRGTRRSKRVGRRRQRFIPACAGNAQEAGWHRRIWSVHPRVCGERADPRTQRRARCGSSPRVRGTRSHLCHPPCRFRFIPACAGNAIAGRTWKMTLTVHPRVCGER